MPYIREDFMVRMQDIGDEVHGLMVYYERADLAIAIENRFADTMNIRKISISKNFKHDKKIYLEWDVFRSIQWEYLTWDAKNKLLNVYVNPTT